MKKKTKGLMEVLSEADNAKHDSYRRESPLSVMLEIHKRACAKGEDVDRRYRYQFKMGRGAHRMHKWLQGDSR